MPALLFTIGIVLTVVGLLTLGFSIPIRGFELGDSLIGAGATGVVGGFVLIGLGAVVREVRRLARTLERPALERPAQPARPPAEARAPAPGRMPLPTAPAPVLPAQRGRAEPRLDAPAGEPATENTQRRPDILAALRAQREAAAPVPEAENVPLSPTQPPRAPAPQPQVRHDEPLAPPGRRPLSPATLASRTAARLDVPRTPPEAPRERPPRNMFDAVWPSEPRRSEPQQERAPERPAGRPTAPPPARPEPPVEPFMLDEPDLPEHASAGHEEAPAPQEQPRAGDEPRGNGSHQNEPRSAGEPRPVAILKSGVIDGMAYTLYTDGSIEAQLPKGLMRFASIEDLRNYLENNNN